MSRACFLIFFSTIIFFFLVAFLVESVFSLINSHLWFWNLFKIFFNPNLISCHLSFVICFLCLMRLGRGGGDIWLDDRFVVCLVGVCSHHSVLKTENWRYRSCTNLYSFECVSQWMGERKDDSENCYTYKNKICKGYVIRNERLLFLAQGLSQGIPDYFRCIPTL